MGKMMRGGLAGMLVRWASGLRFPYLLLVTTLLLVVNLFVPDAIPLADEIIMGLVAVMLANLKKKPEEEQETRAIDETSEKP